MDLDLCKPLGNSSNLPPGFLISFFCVFKENYLKETTVIPIYGITV